MARLRTYIVGVAAFAAGLPILILATAPDAGPSADMHAAYSAWIEMQGSPRLASIQALADAEDTAGLRAMADAGDTDAAIALAERLCASGEIDEAVALLDRAAKTNHPLAMAYLVVLSAPRPAEPADLDMAVALTHRLSAFLGSSDLAGSARRYAREGACVDDGDRNLAAAFVSAIFDLIPNGYAILADWYAAGTQTTRSPIEAYALADAALAHVDWPNPVRARMRNLKAASWAQLSIPERQAAANRMAAWQDLRPLWRQ